MGPWVVSFLLDQIKPNLAGMGPWVVSFLLDQIKPNLTGMGPWVVSFQNCIRQPHPSFKTAAVTKNRNFFNCLLLLYCKSKWAQILTAATWHWVVQHIMHFFPADLYQLGILWIKNHIKFSTQKFELKWSLVGELSKLFVTLPYSINFRSKIENQISDYRLLGTSSISTGSWEPLVYQQAPGSL